MATTWFSCKPCAGSDPTSDVVKVDTSLFQGADKENVKPFQAGGQRDTPEKVSAKKVWTPEELRIEHEAREMQKKLDEEKVRKEIEEAAIAEKVAEENRLRQAEAEKAAVERARLEAEEAAARVAEEERLRRIAQEEAEAEFWRRGEEEAEAARVAEEAARVAEEERKRLNEEKRVAQMKTEPWCRAHGYKDVNSPKKTLRGSTKYPLHTAVKREDADMVKMLLICGANKEAKDSQSRIALQLAEKVKSSSARAKILDALS